MHIPCPRRDTWSQRAACLLLTALSVINLPAFASGASDMFHALNDAPLSTDLPAGRIGDSLASSRNLRPASSYPTLRLDAREPRTPQVAEKSTANTLLPITHHSDFETMVQQTLGRSLPVFGHDLFATNARGFTPVDGVNIPADFVLGPGDELYLRAWGSLDIDLRATIDRGGAITIPKVGAVPLAGLRFGELREHLRAVIARSFHGFELSVSLGQLRSIRIYVTGFARSPGSYTVNALSTPVNVLFQAGGPGHAGDLRAVEIHRAGQRVATIDFYDFLLRGKHDNGLRLLPEDVLHIPALTGEVAIAGAVNRPGIYQLRSHERLRDLVRFAGATSVTASTRRVVIERLAADGQRRMEEYPFNDAALDVVLRTGDLVLIEQVSPRFTNAITLRGQVAHPLRHEWREGMRVSDLLPSSDALVSPQYWVALNKENQVADLVADHAQQGFDPDSPNINWEYAAIERVDPVSLQVELLPFHLGKAVLERDPAHDVTLRPGDKITVFSLEDFRTRSAQQPRFVRIEGEVARAGTYPVAAGDTIADLINRAGGITATAYLFGLELRRESVRQQQRTRIEESVDQLEQDYQRHLIDRSRNVLSGDMSLAISPEAAAIHGLIARLRKAKPTGRIVLELPGDIRDAQRLPALTLDDGDAVYVPPRPATIEVVGSVFRQGSFVYARTDVRSYVQKAGLLPTADKRNVYVVRPDGSFSRATRSVKLQPGDTIIVPEKVDRQTAVRRLKDWTQVLYQFGLGAAGLNLLEVF